MAQDVFISYSSHDKSVADAVCAALERAGIGCWIAPRDILASTEYPQALVDAIEGCRRMVLVFSAHANASLQVRREVERAMSKGKFIVPFRIENVSPSGAMEYCLSSLHWHDGFTPPLEKNIDAMAAVVRQLLEREAKAADTVPAGQNSAPAEAEASRSTPSALITNRSLVEHKALPKVNNLPYNSLGTLFKGREEFLEQIRATLDQGNPGGQSRAAAITTATTVYGLGGIGKTRTAIEFAHRYAEEYTALLFVRAESPESLHANLAALCGSLVLDLAEKEARELDVQVNAALHWLQQHPGWFLILDNVDTEEAAQAVEELLVRLAGVGQVLITSRISRWSASIESLALDVLAVEDATDFLLERTAKRRRKRPDDTEQARALALTLGQLALALEQAGAMIDTNRSTFAQYLKDWNSSHDRVLTWFDARLMQYPMSVAVTWQTSFDQLTEPARLLLNLLAWFAPDPIPESLLDVPIAEEDASDTETPSDPHDALSNLEAYSLVTRADEAESPTFTVHRLVQDVTRCILKHDADHTALNMALNWINSAFVGHPMDVRTWPTLEPLAPHVQKCTQFADTASIANPTARLLGTLGVLYDAQARYAESEPLKRRALAINETSYGKEHPKVAIRLNNLALLLQATNRLSEAEPYSRRTVEVFVQFTRATGHPHPHLEVAVNNYGGLLMAMGRTQQESIEVLREILPELFNQGEAED